MMFYNFLVTLTVVASVLPMVGLCVGLPLHERRPLFAARFWWACFAASVALLTVVVGLSFGWMMYQMVDLVSTGNNGG